MSVLHKTNGRIITVRLPSQLLDAIDRYADDELCLRSVAIRMLLERALEAERQLVTQQ